MSVASRTGAFAGGEPVRPYEQKLAEPPYRVPACVRLWQSANLKVDRKLRGNLRFRGIPAQAGLTA